VTAETKLAYVAKTLAILALQSARYSIDGEFQKAVDDVLCLTDHISLLEDCPLE